MPELMAVPAVMARLGIGRTKLYELIDSGELRSVRIGSRRFVTWCGSAGRLATHPAPTRVGGTDDRDGIAGPRVAGYLAKYVTKSAADFGLGTHRVSPHAI